MQKCSIAVPDTLGQVLKAIRRRELGMQHQEFANLIEVQVQKLHDLEQGKRHLPLGAAMALARRLGRCPKDFALYAIRDKAQDSMRKAGLLRKLPPRNQVTFQRALEPLPGLRRVVFSTGCEPFGTVLRRMRVNHLDMTQVQMARRLGCTKYKVCDFENSRRKLSVKAASAMATRLGFSPKLFALLVVRDRVAFQMRQAGIDLQMTFDVRL